CTALSQQPWTDTTKCTFRPRRFEALLDFARVAVGPAQVKPVMAEQFHVECPDGETADETEERFRDLDVEGQPLMYVKREGHSVSAAGRVPAPAARARRGRRPPAAPPRRFGDLFYMIHTMRSGRHHPDGVLWVRNGRHQVVRERVPLTAVAPTLLAAFDVPRPPHMRERPLPV